MKTIILIRHCTTKLNKKGIIQGQKDSPLIKNSKNEIKYFISKIKDIEFDYIISSDTGRAKKTTEKLIQELKYDHILYTDHLLREVNSGDYSLQLKNVIMNKDIHFKKEIKYIPPNGESYESMIKRIKIFYNKIKNKGRD